MKKAVVGFIVGVVFVIGGAALASIPDPSGVIHGCYNTNNGSLRVIDSASQTCSMNETSLNWSQTGPQGPTGPAGTSIVEEIALAPNATVQYTQPAGTIDCFYADPSGNLNFTVDGQTYGTVAETEAILFTQFSPLCLHAGTSTVHTVHADINNAISTTVFIVRAT